MYLRERIEYMIGIIAAMDKEIDELKALMSDVNKDIYSGMEFWAGKLSGKDTVLVRCGVGKVNAAMAAEVLSVIYKVECIINTGIAGSLNAEINIGDIVLSTEALEHDMDVSGLGYEPGIIPDQDESIFVADNKLRETARKACENADLDIKVFEGRVLSGDQFISDKNKKDYLVNQFAGMCTEMEGASIAHVASLNNIPFLIIRSISDKADDSANMDYPEFQKIAIKNSVKLMSEMISMI